jgi:hypothetical protein
MNRTRSILTLALRTVAAAATDRCRCHCSCSLPLFPDSIAAHLMKFRMSRSFRAAFDLPLRSCQLGAESRVATRR